MKKNPAHKVLFDKWSKKNQELSQSIVQNHGDALNWLKDNSKNLALGSLGGLLMLASAGPAASSIHHTSFAQEAPQIDRKAFLVSDLSTVLPQTPGPMDAATETKVESILDRTFDIKVKAQLEGKRLNTTYGIIGAEQHLARFPGDSLSSHFDNPEDAQSFASPGMAPGLGAWGYFATSSAEMTREDSDREKYYIAVQTFLSADFSQQFAEYRDFYRFRKMLVVNPYNGKAVVADIGDAGPAVWTGKHLGGSPEVMQHLEKVDGSQKSAVLFFFIDDPENKVPLGPIEVVK